MTKNQVIVNINERAERLAVEFNLTARQFRTLQLHFIAIYAIAKRSK